MRKTVARYVTAASLVAVAGTLALGTTIVTSQEVSAAGKADIEKGRELAFDRKKGNCLACHMIEGGDLPGNIGPPLVAMKARFPDKAKLHAQIWDATAANPATIMPPFGKHKVMSDEEIDLVTEFIYTL